jgi:multidrug efflux system membrane fusion protein
MIALLLLLYAVPIYLIFFKYKLVRLTIFWKVFLWVPPVVALEFLWFALGRYTPLAQDAYVQAPVIQVAPEVGGFVTELAVKDNQEVKQGSPLFQIDKRPYQYRVDQANAKWVEAQENVAALMAAVYAAEETIVTADANLLVARQNFTAAQRDWEAAQKTASEVAKQFEVAEMAVSRAAKLLPKAAIAASEYEATLSDAAAQRARWIDAQNRVSRAETEREVSTLQVNSAEAAVREARALRGKAEVLVDPVKTLRRAVETRHADLEQLKLGQPGPSSVTQDRADQIKDVIAELDRLREYLKTAESIDPFRQSGFPTVRQAKEALNDAAFALERTTIKASADGIVANFQLTEGTYARPGIPVASLIDTTRWRMVAAVPENWLEKIRPGDKVYFSLRNYPGRLRTAKVEYVGRGVVQGQGVPSGNLPDTDPRRTRQTDTPQAGQEFQVVINLLDDHPDQPLRVGATGRVTIFAGGGFPVVNGLATILHTVFSWLDYLHPKPSLLMVVLAVALIGGTIAYLRRRSNAASVK